MQGPVVRLVAGVARLLPDQGLRREVVLAFKAGYRRRCRREGRVRGLLYAGRTVADLLLTAWSVRRGRTFRGPEREPMLRRGDGWMAGFTVEARQAWRVLRRSPGFTLTAVAILGLSIGGNSAVFSALEAVVLRPPPYPEPDRLVLPKILRMGPGSPDTVHFTWSHPKYRMLEEGVEGTLQGSAAYAGRTVTLRGRGDPERIPIELVTPDYFGLLGVEAFMGRTFVSEEDGPDPPGVAVLGYGLWSTRFGQDPGVVGTRIELNGHDFTVVGVLPVEFKGLLGNAQAWVSLQDARTLFSAFLLDEPQGYWLNVVARLDPGVTVEEAQERVGVVGAEIERVHPLSTEGGWAGAGLVTLAEARTHPRARTSLLVLVAAAALVLLIGILNLSGLLLNREMQRVREVSVRVALGSGTWRLLRGRLFETGTVVALGGLFGLAVAYLAIQGIVAVWPSEFSGGPGGDLRAVDITTLGLDVPVLSFSFAVSAGVALVLTLLPGLAHRRLDPVAGLKEGGSATARAWGRRGSGRFLVAGQAALAVVLLVGTGLMGSSLFRLQQVERGFDDEGLVAVSVSGIDDGDGAAWPPLLERIRGLPGVTAVTQASVPPYGGWAMSTFVSGIEGREPFAPGDRPEARLILVGPDYFDVLRAEILGGSTFRAGAEGGIEPVVLSATAAREIFGGEDPLGRIFRMGIQLDGSDGRYRAVGIVRDVLQAAPGREPASTVYTSLEGRSGGGSLLVRSEGDAMAAVPAIRAALRQDHPDAIVTRATTVADLGAATVGDTRILLALLGIFAALALTLAGTGVYGVVAFGVTRRRRELGLRIALGARGAAVAGRVLGQGMATALTGIALGLVVAWVATPWISGLLFEVEARDIAIFAGGTVVLLVVAGLASWLPARRITRLDPADVLKVE